jgi:hypothetical protein
MNLQRNLGHSSFIGSMGFTGQESIAFRVVGVDGRGLDFVMSLRSLEQSALRKAPVSNLRKGRQNLSTFLAAGFRPPP